MPNPLTPDAAPPAAIPGYDYGRPEAAHSLVTLEEPWQIESSLGWTDEDAAILQRRAESFRAHAERLVDARRALIAARPHLAAWLIRPDGKRDDEYASKVKKRLVPWVVDACVRPHDQAWLHY